jgi:hypothetical protein
MTLREQPSSTAEPSATLSLPADAAPAASTPSPVPLPDRSRAAAEPGSGSELDSTSGGSTFLKPKLRLKIYDLDHPGAAKFLTSVNTSTVLSTAVNNVLRLLYKSPSEKDTTCPPTRSVTLVLRDMDGVAYTTGVWSLPSYLSIPYLLPQPRTPDLHPKLNPPRPTSTTTTKRSTSPSTTSTRSTRRHASPTKSPAS